MHSSPSHITQPTYTPHVHKNTMRWYLAIHKANLMLVWWLESIKLWSESLTASYLVTKKMFVWHMQRENNKTALHTLDLCDNVFFKRLYASCLLNGILSYHFFLSCLLLRVLLVSTHECEIIIIISCFLSPNAITYLKIFHHFQKIAEE